MQLCRVLGSGGVTRSGVFPAFHVRSPHLLRPRSQPALGGRGRLSTFLRDDITGAAAQSAGEEHLRGQRSTEARRPPPGLLPLRDNHTATDTQIRHDYGFGPFI